MAIHNDSLAPSNSDGSPRRGHSLAVVAVVGLALAALPWTTFSSVLNDRLAIAQDAARRTEPPSGATSSVRASAESTTADSATATALPDAGSSRRVRVELVEGGVTAEAKWPAAPGVASESYEDDAFGFFRIPWRYADTGVRADRANPLLFRATADVALPSGKLRVLVRSRSASRLTIDGRVVAELAFSKPMADGHNALRKPVLSLGQTRFVSPGNREIVVEYDSPGGDRRFVLETIVGGLDGKRPLRPELGELVVAVAPAGSDDFQLVSPRRRIPLTDEGWHAWRAERDREYKRIEADRRHRARRRFASVIAARHDAARAWVTRNPPPAPPDLPAPPPANTAPDAGPIDRFLLAGMAEPNAAGVEPAPLADDLVFLRRMHLNTVGVAPTLEEIDAFLADRRADRRARLIDRLLDDPRGADVWTSRWQDWLGEHPNLVNATLNNTGPFRYWIHESFLDHKPLDLFARELVSMRGSVYGGGPAGFGLSAQNDAPMVAKAGVLAGTFLGVEMKCARCHDAPYHASTQTELFQFAGLLAREPIKVPGTSTVVLKPADGRAPLIRSTLKPGEVVPAAWPFAALVNDATLDGARANDEVHRSSYDSRDRLADLLTSPANERFADVLANRLWQHAFGRGLVEPANDWEHARPTHPALLKWLARELASHGYDSRHLLRSIYNSQAWQRGSSSDAAAVKHYAAMPKLRLSAEQVVDSLFASFGVPLDVGEICIDLDGGRPPENGLNLGRPRRAWEFAYTSNDRDRPSLNLPRVRAVTELLAAFGWPDVRQESISDRKPSADVLQAALLQNGVLSRWLTRLSDESAMTALALDASSPERLVRDIYRRLLTRPPTPDELRDGVELLGPGFVDRHVAVAELPPRPKRYEPYVAWSNHLDPESTVQRQKEEAEARRGPEPTPRLDSDWRARCEDLLWTLLNAPEAVLSP